MPNRAVKSKTGPEQRRHARERAALHARVFIPDGTAFDCIIQDWSESGARLRVPLGFQAREVDVIAPHSDKRIAARIVWRNAHSIGVAFRFGGADGSAASQEQTLSV